MINNYWALFYADIVGLTASAIFPHHAVLPWLDAIKDPMMGAIADKICNRWCQFQPYLMFAPPLYCLETLDGIAESGRTSKSLRLTTTCERLRHLSKGCRGIPGFAPEVESSLVF